MDEKIIENEINTEIQMLGRKTVEELRTYLILKRHVLGSSYLRKDELLRMIKDELIYEKSPKPLNLPYSAFLVVGNFLDAKSVRNFALTCKHILDILKTNRIWQPKCEKEIPRYLLLGEKDKGKKNLGFWMRWYNKHIPINIPLQAPILETWDTGKVKKNIKIPTVGTLLQRDQLRRSPGGIMLTSNLFYVCTKVQNFKKGRNKGLPKIIWVAKDTKNYEFIEEYEADTYTCFTLVSQQQVKISPKGFIQCNFTVITRKDIYP